jgi:hypothetical protein
LTGDLEVLARGDDEHARHGAGQARVRATGRVLVGRAIDRDSAEADAEARLFAHGRRVLADAAGEDERVDRSGPPPQAGCSCPRRASSVRVGSDGPEGKGLEDDLRTLGPSPRPAIGPLDERTSLE